MIIVREMLVKRLLFFSVGTMDFIVIIRNSDYLLHCELLVGDLVVLQVGVNEY